MKKTALLWPHPITQIVAVLALWKVIDFILAILAGIVLPRVLNPAQWTPELENAASDLVAAVCAVATVLLLQRLTGNVDLGRIGLTKTGAGRETALGFLVGMTEYLAFMLCLILAHLFVVTMINTHFPVTVFLLDALLIGFQEEVLFRGYIFQKLETSYGTGLALLVSSVVFGVYHVGGGAYGLHYLRAISVGLPSGLCYASAYLVSRRLWLPIGIHSAWDFFAFVFWGDGTGNEKPLLLDLHINLTVPAKSIWLGDGLGLAVSPISIGLDLGLSILFLVIAMRRGQWLKGPTLPLFRR